MPAGWKRTALGLVMACGAAVGADDPPPLEPPSELPPLTVPTPPALEPAPSPEDRPILAVPGLPTPRRPATVSPRPAPAPTTAPSLSRLEPLPDGPPPLVAPSDAPGLELAEPAPPQLSGASHRGESLSLEPVPADGLDPLKPIPHARPDREGDPEKKPKPRATAPPPPRRGLFGMLFSRPAPPPPAEEPIRVDPRDDPAADAALKRRIEAQVRRAVGDRTRAIDVRVVDRKVHIRVQVQRFWQKRSVRRTLETLPALSGYKTVVDVVE